MVDFEFFIFIADLHAITEPQDPKELKENIRNLAALYLACGLSPERLTLFVQSEVNEHAALGYVMQSICYMGELERMTQYKDKMQKQVQGVSSALFTYPALMAADILLYDAKYVPVGEDQKQHLELARDLAIRFNNRFGDTFVVPEGLISEKGARIMDLQNPLKKMSKSENDRGCIFLLEPLASVRKKIMSAVTDSGSEVRFDKANKPGIANLMTIHSVLSGLSFQEIEAKYAGQGYGTFKKDVAELVVKELEGIQERYNKIISSEELDRLFDEGGQRAQEAARKKLREVYGKLGLGRN
ncbi:MAG TPA: tryptophan--tRNA ligase, partial [Acholeplasmataceae bacterium]|nr:tryptophan--tRNA ligase [Acholeplasmataceae bacterium]